MKYRIALFIAFWVPSLFAIPVSPTPPIAIKGKVVRWAWISATTFKSNGDGLLSGGEIGPTYYLIIKTARIPSDTKDMLSHYARRTGNMAVSHAITQLELKKDEILVQLPSELIDHLQSGSQIEIIGYTMFGDEWGCTSEWTSIKIDGKLFPERKRRAKSRK